MLAALYSSAGSILERHHLSQTMCLINTKKCNILKHLDQTDYQEAIELLQHFILITDLANHFKHRAATENMVGKYDPNDAQHQKLLSGLIMTCCDLSQVTKPTHLALATARKIFEEFHQQGDKEKEYGVSPTSMMDREKTNLPVEQIGFLQHVALPAYLNLAEIIPSASVFFESASSLKAYWQNQMSLN